MIKQREGRDFIKNFLFSNAADFFNNAELKEIFGLHNMIKFLKKYIHFHLPPHWPGRAQLLKHVIHKKIKLIQNAETLI